LSTRLEWQKKLADAQQSLDKEVVLIDAIQRGTQDPQLVGQLAGRSILAAQDTDAFPGVVHQEHVLRMQNRSRGRVWRDAFPQGAPDPQTGAVLVGFNEKRAAGAAAE